MRLLRPKRQSEQISIFFLLVLIHIGVLALKLSFPETLSYGTPFLLLPFIVILSSIIGGFTWGLASTLITSLIVGIYFGPGHMQTAAYVIEGTLIAYLIKRQQNALQKNREFALIIESSEDAIISLSPEGEILTWNKGAERMYDYKTADVIGKKIHFLAPKDQHPDINDLLAAVKVGERIEHHEAIRFGKNRERQFMQVSYAPIYERGQIIGAATIARNITKQKQLEQELKDINDRLEIKVAKRTKQLESVNAELVRSNKELEEFAYVASHDLQEPLRKIQSFANLLKEEYRHNLSETETMYVNRMLEAASRMRRLIEDLLTFARVSTKTLPFQDVDLNFAINEVLVDLESRVSELKGQVTVQPLPSVYADPVQMRQLFQNLLSNSLKFHRPHLPPIINIHADQSAATDHAATILVTDNGIGINEKYVDRIFQIFERLHGKTEYEGTGVGLSIVRKIIERHNGSIEVRSQPNQGATFVISLPINQHKGAAS